MLNPSLARPFPDWLRQPIALATLASLGLHGIFFAVLPQLSWNFEAKVSNTYRSVPVIELTPDQQAQLPTFAQSSLNPGLGALALNGVSSRGGNPGSLSSQGNAQPPFPGFPFQGNQIQPYNPLPDPILPVPSYPSGVFSGLPPAPAMPPAGWEIPSQFLPPADLPAISEQSSNNRSLFEPGPPPDLGWTAEPPPDPFTQSQSQNPPIAPGESPPPPSLPSQGEPASPPADAPHGAAALSNLADRSLDAQDFPSPNLQGSAAPTAPTGEAVPQHETAPTEPGSGYAVDTVPSDSQAVASIDEESRQLQAYADQYAAADQQAGQALQNAPVVTLEIPYPAEACPTIPPDHAFTTIATNGDGQILQEPVINLGHPALNGVARQVVMNQPRTVEGPTRYQYRLKIEDPSSICGQ